MTQPLSDRELRKLLEQVTPGLWEWRSSDGNLLAGGASRGQIDRETDARLITAAPALAEEVLRLRQALRELSLSPTYDPQRMYSRVEGHPAAAELIRRQDIARAALQEGSAE